MPRRFNLAIPSRIDVQIAEQLLSKLNFYGLEKTEVVIDFRQCEYVDVGAGYRLGNALRTVAESADLTVLIPDEEFSKGPSGRWFLAFTRSGIGPALAAHAPVVYSSGRDVTEDIKGYYARTLGIAAQNAVYFNEIHLGRLDVENESGYARAIFAQFQFLNVSPRVFDATALSSLVALCFEATQNTVDHAAKKPLEQGNRVQSYLSLRYYKHSERPREGAFLGYLKRIAGAFERKDDVRFLEIVVNDDGVGIPGRQSQSLEIYRGALGTEEKALGEALTRGTIKLTAGDSRTWIYANSRQPEATPSFCLDSNWAMFCNVRRPLNNPKHF